MAASQALSRVNITQGSAMKIWEGRQLVVSKDRATELQPIALVERFKADFDEAWLQRLIFHHPSCIPTGQIEPGFDELISVCCEFPTPRGSVDNVFITTSGDLVIAEVKLWRNPEARRKVVAQVLD